MIRHGFKITARTLCAAIGLPRKEQQPAAAVTNKARANQLAGSPGERPLSFATPDDSTICPCDKGSGNQERRHGQPNKQAHRQKNNLGKRRRHAAHLTVAPPAAIPAPVKRKHKSAQEWLPPPRRNPKVVVTKTIRRIRGLASSQYKQIGFTRTISAVKGF